jgi:hypothetical protein
VKSLQGVCGSRLTASEVDDNYGIRQYIHDTMASIASVVDRPVGASLVMPAVVRAVAGNGCTPAARDLGVTRGDTTRERSAGEDRRLHRKASASASAQIIVYPRYGLPR